MLKNKNGQFKSFLHLYTAVKQKHGASALTNEIFSASVVSGIKGLSQKQEREIMYTQGAKWQEVINLM